MTTDQNKKHYGVLRGTGTRVAIVMMQVPDSPLRSLIIELDSLPPYHDELLSNVMMSDRAKEASVLADVLGATNVPGTGRSLMMEFHINKLMRSEPIENILLTPNNKTSVPLRDVLASMGKLGVNAALLADAEQAARQAAEVTDPKVKAANLMAEAEMLETQAREKRAMAIALDPSLNPVQAETTTTDTTTVENA